jgi:hypothetical protein
MMVRIASAAGATEGTATFEEPAACAEGQPPLLQVELAAETLRPGERLEVSARVEYPDQATAITHCYMMGRDGVLHEASASASCLAK